MTLAAKMVPTRYKIVLPDHKTFASVQAERIEWPEEPGLTLIQNVIKKAIGEQNNMEHTSVWWDFNGGSSPRALDMFVDDVGAIKDLPRNQVATAIYRYAAMTGHSGMGPDYRPSSPEDLNAIYGPAIIFDRMVWL